MCYFVLKWIFVYRKTWCGIIETYNTVAGGKVQLISLENYIAGEKLHWAEAGFKTHVSSDTTCVL